MKCSISAGNVELLTPPPPNYKKLLGRSRRRMERRYIKKRRIYFGSKFITILLLMDKGGNESAYSDTMHRQSKKWTGNAGSKALMLVLPHPWYGLIHFTLEPRNFTLNICEKKSRALASPRFQSIILIVYVNIHQSKEEWSKSAKLLIYSRWRKLPRAPRSTSQRKRQGNTVSCKNCIVFSHSLSAFLYSYNFRLSIL